MPRAFFQNVSAISIGGKQPSEIFQIAVDDDGAPVELYWRKRLADQTVSAYVPPSAPEPTPAETSPSGDASEVKSAKKKGA